MSNIQADAELVWDYMHLHHELKPADVILVLGSHDKGVANYAAELYLRNLAPRMIFSGGLGRLTDRIFTRPEAEEFATIAQKAGVPEGAIFIENRSTNTGENLQLSAELMQAKHIPHDSIILVQKPYMERRTYATFLKQWLLPISDVMVTSQPISFEAYCAGSIDKDAVINIMVGDLQRIKEYPSKGFQIPQEIPDEVWAAYERLVAAGYDKQLIAKERI